MVPIFDLLEANHQLLTSPVSAGFISMVLRYLPYSDYAESAEIRKETIDKELHAAQVPYHPVTLNYSSFLSPSPYHRHVPLFGKKSSPAVASQIHSSFEKAKTLISDQLLVPKVSRKTILRKHGAPWWKPYDKHALDGKRVKTLADVERVYVKTGVWLHGLTEMRSAWRGNDLKPRVYYARGASPHPACSVIQQIFNIFVDSLRITHRKLRFNLHELEGLTFEKMLFLYDYTSFTSSLHEIRNFTDKLAEYCRGTVVKVLDGKLGIVDKDLGELLHEYNRSCNMELDFDVSEILAVEDWILRHNCGALGLPGNISSCTLLHGIHLAFILDSLMRGKVVGDDAIGIFVDDEYEHFERSLLVEELENIGMVSEEKTEFFDGDDDERGSWKYTKRPIFRDGSFIGRGEILDWPSLDLVTDMRNPFHRRPSWDTTNRRFSVLSKQLVRFRDGLSVFPPNATEKLIITSYLETFYNRVGRGMRNRIGSVTVDDSTFFGYFPNEDDFLTYPPVEMVLRHPGCLLVVPRKSQDRSFTLNVGSVLYGPSTSVLAYLGNVGLVKAKMMTSYALARSLPETFVEDLLSGRVSFEYSFEIVEDLPDWSYPLLESYIDV